MKKSTVISFLVLANIFWAGNYIFGKYVVAEMTPIQMTFSRWLIAVVFLFPIAHLIEHPNWKEVWARWKILLAMAVTGVMTYNYLLYEALRYTSSLNASLVNSVNPVLIALCSALILKEKIPFKNKIGLCISLCGVLLVLTKGQLLQIFRIEYNTGDLLMILAILVWTLYSILGKKIQSIPPISATAVSVLIGLIVMIPFVLNAGIQIPQSAQAIIGIIYMGLFPSVGAFIFWNIGIRQIGPGRAGIFMYLITVFTAIIGLVLGQPITFIQIAGGILVFIGVYMSSSKPKSVHDARQ
ncbi:DMT family transporter [Paenibacillus apiarius]|uniref:DMT family transporter n=1 Tax=Paenibacillus apiarius TaxID=46240 RepID=A0ABT4DYF7_9BACL|nr:DMT family transporter [Paenibacillus apiarius]MCY9514466.1 DMT family transporter [Paenibacillus apiarius]MCY9520996.1 DMT family transporter [Paenibacillus apiarius]MCY9551842.1 DMT family transporter [Paenibacillus apiarius]MCY9557730.1 DMT family transporter [Paenibacillus apiarius]MCY9684417.1 DMT family transporter [Paenibacillus apiarius]